MSEHWSVIAACAVSFIIAGAGTGALSRILAHRGIMDLPNQRSSHQTATPRGGGIAVIAAFLGGLAVMMTTGAGLPAHSNVIIPATLLLAGVSWIDDVRGLPALVRFIAQALCVCGSIYLLPIAPPGFLAGLPEALQFTLLALAWLWFLNLYNFMDGIDGITGVETMTIAIGIALLLTVTLGGHALVAPALIIAAAMPGFLYWNWAPAKIFMGDVGSVTLGYLLGWMLLTTAGDGFLIPALLLPAYYLADATYTLFRRALKGEKIWQPHRQHAYQKAVRNGMTHGRVSICIGLLGMVLIGLSLLSIASPGAAVLAGAVLTLGLIYYFSRTHV